MTESEKKKVMANDDLLIYLVRKIKTLDCRIERLEPPALLPRLPTL